MTILRNALSPACTFVALALIVLGLGACSSGGLNDAFDNLLDMADPEDDRDSFAEEDIAEALKQALRSGVRRSTTEASRSGGYERNADLHIPVPPELGEFPIRLRQLGMGTVVDRFEVSLNIAAEKAAGTAQPIFVGAIRRLTIRDAWEILSSEDDAATEYLRRETFDELYDAFKPEVVRQLGLTGSTRLFRDLVKRYNQIPRLDDVTFDLEDYTTRRAIDGLFFLVAKEEQNIRENPAARTTELMQRIFGANIARD